MIRFMPIRLKQVAGYVLGYYPASVRFPSASVGVSASSPDEKACIRHLKRILVACAARMEAADLYGVLYEDALGTYRSWGTKRACANRIGMEQTMKNKIQAFLDRGEIRDCYDIEFLIRRGVALPVGSEWGITEFRKKIARFKDMDFKVKLGSILERDIRDYYVENRFSFLEEKLLTVPDKKPFPGI